MNNIMAFNVLMPNECGQADYGKSKFENLITNIS